MLLYLDIDFFLLYFHIKSATSLIKVNQNCIILFNLTQHMFVVDNCITFWQTIQV